MDGLVRFMGNITTYRGISTIGREGDGGYLNSFGEFFQEAVSILS